MKSKTEEFYAALYDLRQNYTTGIHTWAGCCNGCGEPARGGGPCAKCCEKRIAEITGDKKLAMELHAATHAAYKQVCKAIDILEGS